MTPDGPRPHGNQDVPPLAARPLTGFGVARVVEQDVRLPEELPAQVTLRRPELADGRAPRRPSPLLALVPELAEPRAVAREGFEHDGALVAAHVPFPAGTSFYGTGEVAGPLLRTGRATTLWNTDAWCYGDESPALYQSHPVVLAVLPDGRATALFADSFRRGRVELAVDGVEFVFEDEPFDLYRIDAARPLDALRGLSALLGRMPMPPLWALGYHQCRWSYGTAEEVRAVARGLREHDVPCSAIWLDIGYMDRFRVFTWDRAAFPDPRGLLDELHEQGLRAVAILDPGIALAEDYDACDDGLAGAHHVTTPDGAVAVGRAWPGRCWFPDFTAARTRGWWADRVERFLREHPLDGLWNDMNEPALRAPSKTLPEDARHAGDERTGPGSHARFHNLYGDHMVRATRAGIEAAHPGRRPFVLTRAACAGTARFAATWTGDNQARWEDLRWSIAMTLNLALSGQPFAGPDVGGFYGDPTPELFVRWFELGAFLPFFRGHAEERSCRKEPWSFGPEVLAHVRRAIRRRERLLPTLYTLFEECARTGAPVARPLFLADPADPALRAVDDAFLVGPDLLVAPVVEPGATRRTVRLPRGEWYAYPDGGARLSGEVTVDAPLGTLPLFARAGAVLLEQEDGELVARAFLGPDGRASGAWYRDAGDGVDLAPADFERLRLRASARELVVERVAGALGDRPTPRLVALDGAP